MITLLIQKRIRTISAMYFCFIFWWFNYFNWLYQIIGIWLNNPVFKASLNKIISVIRIRRAVSGCSLILPFSLAVRGNGLSDHFKSKWLLLVGSTNKLVPDENHGPPIAMGAWNHRLVRGVSHCAWGRQLTVYSFPVSTQLNLAVVIQVLE